MPEPHQRIFFRDLQEKSFLNVGVTQLQVDFSPQRLSSKKQKCGMKFCGMQIFKEQTKYNSFLHKMQEEKLSKIYCLN